MSQPDEFGTPRDLAAAYALGALSADEERVFEAHLAQDAATRQDVAEFREVVALLALAAPESADMRRDLRDRVAATARGREGARAGRRESATEPSAGVVRVPPSRPRALAPLYGSLAASLLLAAWLGWQRAELGRTVADLRAQLQNETTKLAARERTLNSIFEPGVELYRLTAVSGETGPIVQFFWDRKNNRAMVHSSGVRELPTDREYQLWFIQDGKAVPSVTFRPEPGGHAQLDGVTVPTGATISAAALTEEPAGGSQQPTSPIYMVGSLEPPAPARPGGRAGA